MKYVCKQICTKDVQLGLGEFQTGKDKIFVDFAGHIIGFVSFTEELRGSESNLLPICLFFCKIV